ALYNNGTELFSVDQTKITSALPHEFTAAGDISAAYDLVFTNQTAALIESYGPLTISSGESFESNNLNLRAYGTGVINIIGSGLAIEADEYIYLDSNDGSNSTIRFNNAGNYVTISSDGTEVARFMSDGSVDGNTTFDT